jgi:hypothetical protein
MNKRVSIIAFIFVLMAIAADGSADMVILKTGEMFQTRRAWKENGVVNYYRNGRLVRVDESEVERLIQAPDQTDTHPPAVDRPTAASPPRAPLKHSSGEPPPPDAAGDEIGYLGLTWGQSPSQIEGLTEVGVDPAYGGVQLYTRNQGTPRFGRAVADNIFFGFWQGRLYTILVEVSNYLDFTELKAEAFRRYGKGEQEGGAMDRYRWTHPSADRMLVYDDDSESGYLWMRSRAVHDAVRARYPE